MVILDFLIYNLTNWYIAHKKQLSWSTPLERAAYVAGIITMLWFFDFWLMINTFLLKNDKLSGASEIILIILGVCAMILYQHIYGKQGRYEKIKKATIKPFNVSDNVGQAISIGLLFLPMIIFGILLICS